jgi:hypothetical protein
VGTNFDAAGSGGGSLRTNTGTACLQWAGGGGTNVTIDGAINMNGANSAVSMAPTGTGTVTINPATASNMNNVAIGGTTPLAGTFTTLRVNSTISLAGTTGSAGNLLQSNGASAPTWVAQSTIAAGSATTATTATNANNVAIIDDTTTATTVYPVWANSTSGNQALETSSTKLSFVPSTGTLTATAFSGSGASLTTLNASNLSSGTVGTARLASGTANSGTFLRGDQTWASAGGATITDDTTTNATRYILFDDVTSGTLTAVNTSSTKLTYNPSTGALSAVSMVSSSDERFKDNIKTIENALTKLEGLRGVSYTRNDRPEIGVIAQEVEKIIPEVVQTGEDGFKTVSYGNMIGLLIEAVKELSTEVNKLKAIKE